MRLNNKVESRTDKYLNNYSINKNDNTDDLLAIDNIKAIKLSKESTTVSADYLS